MAKQAMKWIAPKDSQAHQVFIRKAEEAGYPSSLVRDFFYQINAHPYLLCFVQISRNLIEILRLPCEQWSDHSGEVDFKAWRSLSRWVVEHAEALTEVIGTQFDERPRRVGDNPLVNRCVTRHPLYSALWNYQEKPELRCHYAELQAQALFAYSIAVRETYSLETYEAYAERDPLLTSPKDAHAMGQAMRELSHGFAEGELLAFDPSVPPKAFGASIKSALKKLKLADYDEDTRHIDQKKKNDRQLRARYFGFFIQRTHAYKAWSDRRRHRRNEGSGGSGGESGYVDFDKIAQGWDVKGEEGLPHRFVPSISVERGKSTSQALKWDDLPFDDEEGTYFYADPGDDLDDPDKKRSNPATTFLRARNQARHIAMANQYLPWRYQSLTLQEIHNVVMAAKSYLTTEALVSRSSEQLGFFELALLTLIVFWTGSSWENAAKLRVKRSEQSSSAKLCLIFPACQKQWRVESATPIYRTKLDEPEKVVRPLDDHIFLPDVGEISDWVLRLMDARQKRPSPGLEVFKVPVEQHRAAFRHLVEKAGESERVTWTSWERVLFDAIVAETGDVVDAVAITGEPHALAQTKSYYSTPRRGDLVGVYLRTTRKLASQAELGVDTDFDLHMEQTVQISKCVGSRACATKPAVVDALVQLKGKLKSNRAYEGWSGFARYHNLFTFYTVQMLAFATGYRAVRTPFLTLDEVNGHLSVTIISDKDNERKHKSRLSYLPPVVWRQLEHYERHLEVLFATNDFQLKRGGETEGEPCFWISLSEERAGTQEVRPRTLEPYLKDFLGLPANAHRRFMRTELKEAGCPADYVNAFMGHASYGEEPWCSYSSLSVKNYRAMMTLYLEPILSELRFEPVASRLVAGGVRQ